MPRPRLEDAGDRLLAAGLALFARRGCERVNSNAIARAAGVGIGTFYLHFANKYALLRALQLRTLAGLRAARQAADATAGPALDDRVRASIAAAVEFARLHPDAYRVCFGQERGGSAQRGPVVTESTRPIADVLRALQRARRVEPELDPELAARAYLAMEVGTLLWWLEDVARCAPPALVETLARAHPARTARIDRSARARPLAGAFPGAG